MHLRLQKLDFYFKYIYKLMSNKDIFKTFVPSVKSDDDIKWYLFDAKDKVVGRLAVCIANYLRGKNRVDFSAHIVPSLRVIVINSSKINYKGVSKGKDRKYRSHSRYPSGLKEKTLDDLFASDPNKVLRYAVRGMLPKNKLRKKFLLNLYIFSDEDHNKAAQKPIKINF